MEDSFRLFDISDSYFISEDESSAGECDKSLRNIVDYLNYLKVFDRNRNSPPKTSSSPSQESANVNLVNTKARKHRRRALLPTAQERAELAFVTSQLGKCDIDFLTSDESNSSFASARSSFFEDWPASREATYQHAVPVSHRISRPLAEKDLASKYVVNRNSNANNCDVSCSLSESNHDEHSNSLAVRSNTGMDDVAGYSADNELSGLSDDRVYVLSEEVDSANEHTSFQTNLADDLDEEEAEMIIVQSSIDGVPLQNDRNSNELTRSSELEEGEIRSDSDRNVKPSTSQAYRLQVNQVPRLIIVNTDRSHERTPSLLNQLNARIKQVDVDYLTSLNDLNVDYRNRNMIAIRCFEILNFHIFDDKLPSNLQIYWNTKINATLGLWSEVDRAISLSPKQLLKGGLLTDILLHEMIHAAVSLIDKVALTRFHSHYFYAWSARVQHVFPELNLLNRCGQSDRVYRWLYICQSCKKTYKRHHNTIDTTHKRCICGGSLNSYCNGGPIVCRYVHERNTLDNSKVYCKLAIEK